MRRPEEVFGSNASLVCLVSGFRRDFAYLWLAGSGLSGARQHSSPRELCAKLPLPPTMRRWCLPETRQTGTYGRRRAQS